MSRKRSINWGIKPALVRNQALVEAQGFASPAAASPPKAPLKSPESRESRMSRLSRMSRVSRESRVSPGSRSSAKSRLSRNHHCHLRASMRARGGRDDAPVPSEPLRGDGGKQSPPTISMSTAHEETMWVGIGMGPGDCRGRFHAARGRSLAMTRFGQEPPRDQ